MATTKVFPDWIQGLLNAAQNGFNVTLTSTGQAISTVAQGTAAAISSAWPTFPGIPSSPVNGSTGPMGDTAAHTVVAAQGAAKKFYCTQLVSANSAGTGTVVAITGLDSGNTYYVPAPANTGGAVLNFDPPLIFAANTAAQAACLTTGTSTYVSANGYAA
jgi:hypothetical protein